ncbi:hypothetical protein U1Q18_030629 [Sarracenia purpurea var. burkii]
MAFSSSNAILSWMDEFSSLEWKNFFNFGLDALFSFGSIRVNWPFLRADSQLWDPSAHVFRFSQDDLCSVVEGFAVILEVSSRSEVDVPTPFSSPRNMFIQLCDFSKHVATVICHEEVLDISHVVDRFFPLVRWLTPFFNQSVIMHFASVN